MTDSAQHRSVRTVGQTQPLRGIVVVSLEQAVAAPLATRHLADLGATVIKVERPGGDFARAYDATVAGTSAYFAWANRGKQSLVLDLKEAGDRTAFDELLAAADVFVHNVSPRAARGLGIDVATLSERFPELITADVCGYGEGGPRSDEKAYDLAIQAEVGVFAVTGGDDMSKVGFSVADISAGMYAYAGILAALVGRSLTGTASHVPVSMLDSLTEWMAAPLYGAVYGGGRPPRTGHRHHAIAPYGCFALAEGETVLIAVQNEREWQRLATDVLGRPDLAADERFGSNAARLAHVEVLEKEITAALQEMPSAEAMRRLSEAQIAVARVNDLDEVWQHEQLRERDRFMTVGLPGGREAELLRPVFGGDDIDGQSRVPGLGDHDPALLADLRRRGRSRLTHQGTASG